MHVWLKRTCKEALSILDDHTHTHTYTHTHTHTHTHLRIYVLDASDGCNG